MKNIVLLLSSLLVCANCFANPSFRQSKFWGDLEVSAGISLASLSDNYGICEPNSNLVTSIMLSSGYYVCPRLSLGVSAGISSYRNPDLSYIPIFLDIKAKPFNLDFIADLKLGSQIRFSGDKYFKQGFCAGLFFGYQLYKKGLFHITPGIEYSYTGFRVKNNAPDYIPGNRNAISIKIMIGFGGK